MIWNVIVIFIIVQWWTEIVYKISITNMTGCKPPQKKCPHVYFNFFVENGHQPLK